MLSLLTWGYLLPLTPEQSRQRLPGTWEGAGITIVILNDQDALFGGRRCRYVIRQDIIQFQPEAGERNFANYRLEWPDPNTLILHHHSGTSYTLRRVTAAPTAQTPLPHPATNSEPDGILTAAAPAVSVDGTCRMPLPPGYSIRSRHTKAGLQYTFSGLQYQAGKEICEVFSGDGKIARLIAFHGGLRFSGERSFSDQAEEIFREFMQTEILEEDTYRPVEPAVSQAESAGVRITVNLETEYGLRKKIVYLDAYDTEGGRPGRMITLTESEFFDDGPLFRIMGLHIRRFGELVVTGQVVFAMDQDNHRRHGNRLLAMAAGLDVRKPGRNRKLEQALVGRWTRNTAFGSGTTAGPAGHVVSHLAFFHNNTFLRQTHVAAPETTTITGQQLEQYFVFGNLIVYQNLDGRTESFPIRLDERILQIGRAAYVRD
ncbi:MAG: hypothetical protein JXQ27_16595 [Acidobacteria bacterium]|nr:hypothetical protein [Acidobacteriota bacterium]